MKPVTTPSKRQRTIEDADVSKVVARRGERCPHPWGKNEKCILYLDGVEIMIQNYLHGVKEKPTNI